MKIINTPKEILTLDLINTKDLYFVCATKEKFNAFIKPLTYDQIESRYSKIALRNVKEHDELYRRYFKSHMTQTSFIHASIAGFSKDFSYQNLFDTENYTYYFKLSLDDIKKCAFNLVDQEDNMCDIKFGVEGIVSVLKEWGANRYNDIEKLNKTGINKRYNQVSVVIPFKIKPLFCLEPVSKRKYYHGSTKKLSELKAGTFVTPYKEDAISFAVPWSSDDLVYCDHETSDVKGRPPHHLIFKSNVKKPNDRKIYIYEIKNVETKGAKTNTDKEYPWNRIVNKEVSDFVVEEISSWKTKFKLK